MTFATLLYGKNAFVAGATGEVGRGAAHALAAAGATVYLAGRSAEKLQALNITGKIVAADYSTTDGAAELHAQLPKDLKFDVVVASSGPWWQINKLSQTDPVTLQKAVHANFLSHLNLYATLAGRTTGQYLLVNGMASEGLPQIGLTGVLAYAVKGASQLMAYEVSQNEKMLLTFTHVHLDSSVGHGQFRSKTNDPEEFGKAFVALALGRHTDEKNNGTFLLDDESAQKLIQTLG